MAEMTAGDTASQCMAPLCSLPTSSLTGPRPGCHCFVASPFSLLPLPPHQRSIWGGRRSRPEAPGCCGPSRPCRPACPPPGHAAEGDIGQGAARALRGLAGTRRGRFPGSFPLGRPDLCEPTPPLTAPEPRAGPAAAAALTPLALPAGGRRHSPARRASGKGGGPARRSPPHWLTLGDSLSSPAPHWSGLPLSP